MSALSNQPTRLNQTTLEISLRAVLLIAIEQITTSRTIDDTQEMRNDSNLQEVDRKLSVMTKMFDHPVYHEIYDIHIPNVRDACKCVGIVD